MNTSRYIITTFIALSLSFLAHAESGADKNYSERSMSKYKTESANESESAQGSAIVARKGIASCSDIQVSPSNINLGYQCDKLKESGSGYRDKWVLNRQTYTQYKYNLSPSVNHGKLVISFHSKGVWRYPYELESFVQLNHGYGEEWKRPMYVAGDGLSHAITIDLDKYKINNLKSIHINLSEKSDGFVMDGNDPKAPEVFWVR